MFVTPLKDTDDEDLVTGHVTTTKSSLISEISSTQDLTTEAIDTTTSQALTTNGIYTTGRVSKVSRYIVFKF